MNVLEATGGFETTVAAALAGAGLPLAVVNPRQVRDFARALGRHAKTDAIDSKIIALFAEKIGPQARPIASPEPHCSCSSCRSKDRFTAASVSNESIVSLRQAAIRDLTSVLDGGPVVNKICP